MRGPFVKELELLALNCQQVLRQGFMCTDNEIDEFVRILDNSLQEFTAEYIKRQFRDINTNL